MMRAYPFFEKRKIYELNKLWDFKFLEEMPGDIKAVTYDDRLPVPSAFDAFPAYAGKRGTGVYMTVAEVTPGVASVLKFSGAGMYCEVYVDGKMLGKHIASYTPFEVHLPVSENIKREIVVVTDNRYDYEKCPLHENFFDFYNYGGIIRQVYLEELPDNPIKNVHVNTKDFKTGEIIVSVDFYGDSVPVTCSIDGKELEKFDKREFTLKVQNSTFWSPETPNLHLLTVDSGRDAITVRFGLREVKTKGNKILLNGTQVKLLGYCRHEAHPQFGPSTPESIMISDLQILKDMGCNFIRGSHYQQDPRFLDLCDEMGFLVFSESLGWGQGEKQLTDDSFIEAQMEQTRTMIETDFNHPCIIMWGFLNEGASDREFARNCYSKMISMVKALDPARPVTYASNRRLNDLFLELADIISMNIYPGWYSANTDDEYPLGEVVPTIREIVEGLEKRGLGDKPFIISEIGAAALYGWRDQNNGFWTEAYQSELLKKVCEEVVSNDDITGVALWQFCDCRTYQGPRSLSRARAFNNKGTLDEYRRPKEAYKTVKKIFNAFQNKDK